MRTRDFDLTRRAALLTVGGVGFGAAILGLGAASAAPSAAESRNAKLVRNFCKVWKGKDIDLDKVADAYLADDCVLDLVEGQPPAVGKAAAKALFQAFMKNGERYDLKIVETFAKGPVVANSRVDTTIVAGKPPEAAPVVGVFIVKDGKIGKWSDYPVKA